jgi:hypothetical protein
MSKRNELKRNLLLEERERDWQSLKIPLSVIPDCGQEAGPCECDSGMDYAECCGGDLTADGLTAIKGSFALEMVKKVFHDDVKVRNPRERAEKFLASFPDGHFVCTTVANVRRLPKMASDEPIGALPAVLYHVTYTDVANLALKEGLKPRRLTGKDNYKHQNLSSHPDHVYMTEVHLPFYLARLGGKGKPLTILAIDTSQLHESLLYPDEDYAALALEATERRPRVNSTKRTPICRTDTVIEVRDHIEEFKHLWSASVVGFGNVAYRGIVPPTAIKKVTPSISDALENQRKFTIESDYLMVAYPLISNDIISLRDELLTQCVVQS